jgi:hypothetical protein
MPYMSLGIGAGTVTAVLLSDSWHEVADASFMPDSYEFLWWPGRTPVPATCQNRAETGDIGRNQDDNETGPDQHCGSWRSHSRPPPKLYVTECTKNAGQLGCQAGMR